MAKVASTTRSLIALSALMLGACGPSHKDESGLPIGLLLPFTGTSSATSSNFERAALYAAGRVNAGGGIHGQQVRILSADTHSDPARAVQSAHTLIDAGARIVIGPEDADIAPTLAPLFTSHKMAMISPVIGSGIEATSDCVHPWFRLAPSATSIGEALAKQAFEQGVRSLAILYAKDAYDSALNDALSARFVSLGGALPLSIGIDPNEQSYAASISQVIQSGMHSVVLATPPITGALVVNEYDAIAGAPPQWFLSPLLKTSILVENVAPAALEGALGVAPKIYDTSDDFPNAFAARWQGDVPLEGAYFYYDAVILSALSLESETSDVDGGADGGVDGGSQESLDTLDAAIFNEADPPGQSSGWNDVENTLARIRAGNDMYYSGLTGPMLLDKCGPRKLGATSDWGVSGGRIVER